MSPRQRLRLADGLALPLDAVTQCLAFLGRRGGGKTYCAMRYVEELARVGAQYVTLDPVGVHWGVRLAADGKGPGIAVPVLGGEHGDIPLEAGGGKLVADVAVERGTSLVLDVSHFHKHERKQFVTDFAEQFFYRKKRTRGPVVLVLEESQMFIPQKVFKGEERMLGAFEDIGKLGRNFGIGLVLVSQRPQAVNKDVLNQAEALFVFQTSGPQERKAIEGWIVEKGLRKDQLSEDLPRLKKGDCWVYSPQWLEVLKRVHITERWTFDASATPEFGKAARKAETLAPVDLVALQDAMVKTIERAKEEDPKLLRKQVAEWRDTAARYRAETERLKVRPAVVERKQPVEVPVPVVTEFAAKAVESAVAKLVPALERVGNAVKAMNALLGEARAVEERCRKALVGTHISFDLATGVPSWNPVRAKGVLVETPQTVGVTGRRGVKEMSESAEAAADDGRLGVGLRRVLSAVAQYPEGVGRTQLTVLTGYKRSSRDQYVQRLRTRGLVEVAGDRIVATPASRLALGEGYEPLPTGGALLAYWRGRLPEGERRILDVVVQAYPEVVERSAIDAATGYRRSSRDQYLQRLGARQLVEIRGRNAVGASPLLFN